MSTFHHISVGFLICMSALIGLWWGMVVAYPYISVSPSINCRHFQTQTDAQRLYDKNPTKYSKLDADHDGQPCETLK